MPPTAFRLFLLAGLVPAIALWSQLTVSTLRGTATDQSGAVVVGAKITAVHLDTNLTREVETNENGDFEIPDLHRGVYRLTATHPGFKNFVADNVVLESSQIRRINISFELGAVGAEVTVRADAAVITTENAKIQSEFVKERFEETPVIGDARNPIGVLSTLPLVQNAGGIYSLKFAGQPTSQIQEGIDGHTSDGVNNQVSNIHDVQEVVAVAT